jgi:hypothetical protein
VVYKGATNYYYTHRINEVIHWCLDIYLGFYDLKLEYVKIFFFEILYKYHITIVGRDVDRMGRFVSKNRKFDVTSYYRALQGESRLDFPWKAIWKTKSQKSGFLCLDSGSW